MYFSKKALQGYNQKRSKDFCQEICTIVLLVSKIIEEAD